jgi:outer membrane protein assembly factor BamA
VTLALVGALSTHAQSAPPGPPKVAKIAAVSIMGTTKYPADQVIAASGLKPGDIVGTDEIQAATNRLAGLGVFIMVNYRFTSKGDSINLEFQLQDAPTVPISFDNFPWFTDDEIASQVRANVGLYAGDAPTGGTLLDAITESIGKLLDTRRIPGNITHQLLVRPDGEGMMMQFRIDDSPVIVKSVELGDSLAAASEKLKDRIPDIVGHPYSRFAIDLFENEQIRPLYRTSGHFEAQVGAPQLHVMEKANGAPEDAVDVVIPITPGSIYSWNGVTWLGNAVLEATVLNGLITLKPGEVADGAKIEDIWQTAILEYGKRGYLDTTVFPQPIVDKPTGRVSYRASINEGPQYRMGDLIITGLSPDAQRLLLHSWPIAAGQVFDNAYFQSETKTLAKPSVEIFGDFPIHYTKFGHLLRPDTSRHVVDVYLDFQ